MSWSGVTNSGFKRERVMRYSIRLSAVSIFICAGIFVGGTALHAEAGVNVNINIGPPPIVAPAPPEVVLVPNSDVYFVPGVDYDVFYYDGYWWSPRGDRWYRSRAYNGPWGVVSQRVVPPPVYQVPRDYRQVYRHERHIPYGQWKKEHYRHDQGKHKGHDKHGDHGGKHGDKHGGNGHGDKHSNKHGGNGHGNHGEHGDKHGGNGHGNHGGHGEGGKGHGHGHDKD
jgi:hypothetical protein